MLSVEKLALVASESFGVFTADVAARLGFDRAKLARLVARGVVERLSSRAYRFLAAPRTWNHRLFAACAALGPDAVGAYRTAAAVHRFDDYPTEPDDIEVLVARSARNRNVAFDDNVVVGSTTRLRAADRTIVRGLPVTSAEWTLARLGRIAARPKVEEALDRAEHEVRVTRDSVTDTLTAIRGRGVAGVGKLSAVLDFREAVGNTPVGVLGRRLKRLLVDAGLPAPVLEYAVTLPDGSIRYFDAAYPWAEIGIECDDAASHVGVIKRGRDHKRQNALEACGFRVYRFTFEHITYEPGYVVATIEHALRTSGTPAA